MGVGFGVALPYIGKYLSTEHNSPSSKRKPAIKREMKFLKEKRTRT